MVIFILLKLLSFLENKIGEHIPSGFSASTSFSFKRTKRKLESHKKICQNKDSCNVVMPSDGTLILCFNQYKKSDEAPFIIIYYLWRSAMINRKD